MERINFCCLFICIISIVGAVKRVGAEGKLKTPLTVVCPPFANEGQESKQPASPSIFLGSQESSSAYCDCRLHSTRSGRTAIIKCDFEFKENIILTANLFNFKKWNSTSAYVRMINCLGVKVASDFLSSWMDSPSSALDLWHCGKVALDATPKPKLLQLFSRLKTFIGVGFVECEISSMPMYFLRDRSRAALRVKDCSVDTIKGGIFHNVDEVRYLVIENSYIKQIEGPISSSGYVQLSRKSMHTWDGFTLLNSTIDKIGEYAFNFTHKSDTEDFVVRKSVIGRVELGGISASGDIKVDISENSFSSLGPKALQIAVTGPVVFSNNTVRGFSNSSLKGIECLTSRVNLENNTFYMKQEPNSFSIVAALFRIECGFGQKSYLVHDQALHSIAESQVSGTTVFISVIVATVAIAAIVAWVWRKGIIRTYTYRRQDTPLCKEETPDILQ